MRQQIKTRAAGTTRVESAEGRVPIPCLILYMMLNWFSVTIPPETYGTTAATLADDWLSPVTLRAVTTTFTFTPAGRLSKVASASCVNNSATCLASAAFVTVKREPPARRASSQCTNNVGDPAAPGVTVRFCGTSGADG